MAIKFYLIFEMLIFAIFSSCGTSSNNSLNEDINKYSYDSIKNKYSFYDCKIVDDENKYLLKKTLDSNPINYGKLEFRNEILCTYKFFSVFDEKLVYMLLYDHKANEVKEFGIPLYIGGDFTIKENRDTISFTVYLASPPYSDCLVDLYEGDSICSENYEGTREIVDSRALTFVIIDSIITQCDSLKYTVVSTIKNEYLTRKDTAYLRFVKGGCFPPAREGLYPSREW